MAMSGGRKNMRKSLFLGRTVRLLVALALVCGTLASGRPVPVRAGTRAQADTKAEPTPLVLGERIERPI
jgi:hypothetical protein